MKNAAWAKNPIDRFVLARLEQEHLQPSPPPSREKLIRRVSLDLTGLPPSVPEVQAFVADTRPDAYERVVDRLLASPQYGERMAQPWMDLARYADTNGYEKDNRRTIWPYRDWVIQAFNADMPYDQFTIKQIAGDLLPNATQADKVATGFNRNTMLNEEGGVDPEEQRWLTLVDRTNTTAATWLGSTLACAECHDHKYDPFKQKEYYQFLAFFDHSNEPQITLTDAGRTARQSAITTEIATFQRLADNSAVSPEAQKNAKAAIAILQTQKDALNDPTTLSLEEKADGKTPTTYVHVKGAFLSTADLVTAGTPAFLNPFPAQSPRNRLGLAQWLVDPKNPLTARVEVNRLWEQDFGRGLVETSEDFGTQGQPPTHPQLLDWLATTLMQKGWKLKAIQRLIVTSATYRQSSQVTPALEERDPANRLLARGPRFRLAGETIRDMALSAGGLLSLKVGGPSVFPLAARRHLVHSLQQRSVDNERRRRSLPARPVYILAANLAVSVLYDVRCAEPGVLHGAPDSHEHAAAGPDDPERPRLHRRGAGPGPSNAAGRRGEHSRADHLRLPRLHVPRSDQARVGAADGSGNPGSGPLQSRSPSAAKLTAAKLTGSPADPPRRRHWRRRRLWPMSCSIWTKR